MSDRPSILRVALERLGVDRLVFAIHQSAFPPGPGDSGFGSPYGEAGRALIGFAAGLGFNAIQLGPDGQISEGNASPYDGAAFARNTLSLDLHGLSRDPHGRLLTDHDLEALVRLPAAMTPAPPRRADPARARAVVREALVRAQEHLVQQRSSGQDSPWSTALSTFRQAQASWLEVDALFEVFSEGMGHDDPARFDPAMRALLESNPAAQAKRRSMAAVMARPLQRVELGQVLAQRQATELRAFVRGLGMTLFGDLQVGWSRRDRYLRPSAFHDRWLLGAPPSRTNPMGQPWGYPLLDPDQLDDPSSPARQLLSLRIHGTLAAYDGLRIDHPHGLVCPWIYRADAESPLTAVKAGARAFESPNREEPELKRWAIASSDDLNGHATTPWDEDWVARMNGDQIARWSRLFDEVISIARAHGLDCSAIAAEVLSTCPAPLLAVLRRHGLGRFRVTQKANVEQPQDVYRTDRAQAADWVMLGTHDTQPILAAAERFLRDGSAAAKARYLAERLEPDAAARAVTAQRFASSPGALAQAHLADLFLCAAQNVLLYFTDLFGEREAFNRPGIIHPDNWSLRLPEDFVGLYVERLARGEALDIGAALATALRASGDRSDLPAALDRISSQMRASASSP